MAYKIQSSCCGCHLCAKRCPVGAIDGELKEIHSIDPEVCIDCGACANACNMGCILDNKGKEAVKIPKEQWKKPIVDRGTCVGCSVCVENCPANCLEIEGPKFHGDINTIAIMAREKDCIGCGICGRVCPIEAIHF